MSDMDSMQALIDPRSIAIIGASTNPESMASRPFDFLLKYGYDRPIYPVNPRHQFMNGVRCYPDIESVPRPVDLALLMVAAAQVLQTLRRCAACGVRAALVYAGGFAELGEEGRRVQAEITELSRTSGMRVLGPNCQGVANFAGRVVSNFSSSLQVGNPLPGDIGLVAQSGAIAGVLYPEARKIGMGFQVVIATGNEADVDVSDGIEYLARMPAVKSIGCYIEGLKDYPKFIRAAEAAHIAGRPVIVVKHGRTTSGRVAVLSHTGALAGEDRVYDAVFERANVIRVADIVDLMYTCYVFANCKPLGAGRVAIITNSGGMGVMLTDLVESLGFSLATLSEHTRTVLRKWIPDYVTVTNPIDPAASYLDPGLLDDVLAALQADDGVDLILSFTGMAQTGTDFPLNSMTRAITRAHGNGTKSVVPIWMGGSDEVVAVLRSRGVPVFTEPGHCMTALAGRLRWERGQALARFDRPVSPSASLMKSGAPLVSLNVGESTDFLAKWQLPMARCVSCLSSREAALAASQFGYPVALKVNSRQVQHKSDVGGLRLNLRTGEEVAQAGDEIFFAMRSAGITAEGLQVQEMAADGGLELIVGVRWDAVFGSVIMVGLGGIYAEVFNDTVLGVAPLDHAAALTMLRKLKCFPLLDGARAHRKRDIDALARLLVTLSGKAAAAGPTVQEIDLNPVLIYGQGEGITVVDALVVGYF